VNRRLLSVLVFLCSVVLFAPASGNSQTSQVAAPPINPPVTCDTTQPDVLIGPSLLSSGMPCTVATVAPFSLHNLQRSFDFNSWLAFLALNAPATGGVIGKDVPTVWESWKEVEDVFLADGQAPSPWGKPTIRPAVCPNIPNVPILQMVGKTPGVLSDVIQPFNTGPLIDQSSQYVRFEIVLNQPMFEYIAQNKLYNQPGQTSFGGAITFPQASLNQGHATGTMGAIVIKASWKLLDPKKDQASDFHTAQVLIYVPPLLKPPVQEKCFSATVGLVGLHIVHRTQDEPQWLWATFEHVGNDPTLSDVNKQQLQAHYNFFDPNCTTCTINKQPPRPWNPSQSPFPGGFHSQIVRIIDLMDDAKQLNTAFQKILQGTVWQHYMLVSTQWPTDPESATDPNGVPAPTYLGNTTMETYIQGTTPVSSSRCMMCHGNATDTTGRSSNFTFVLERAQPVSAAGSTATKPPLNSSHP
jgi:hypothetical protein